MADRADADSYSSARDPRLPEASDTATRHATFERVALGLALLVLASALVHGLRVMAAADADRVALLPDDSFYYLTLARSFAASGLWTFDGGVSVTTGFHPLFAYALVPLGALADGRQLVDLATALVLALSLAAFGGAMWRARAAHRWDVVIGLTVVLGSAMVMLLTTIVMEWPLAVLLSGLFWAELARGDGYLGDPRVRRRAGLWLFLAVLARSDLVLLVGPFGAVELAYAIRARAVRWRALWAIAGGLLGYAAVMVHGLLVTGELAQSSAATKLAWALELGVSPGPILTMVAQLFSPVELRFNLGLGLGARLAIVAGGLAVIALAVFALRRARRRPAAVEPMARGLVWAASLTTLGYVGAYAFNSAALDNWYTAPFIAPLVVLVAAAVGRLSAFASAPALGVVVLAYVGAHAVSAHRLDDHRAAQRAIHALASETGAAVAAHRTGAFNAGLFGYLQGGRVVNLDGLVNADISAYRAADRLACYLLERGIERVEDIDLTAADATWWRHHGDSRGLIPPTLHEVDAREVAGHRASVYAVDRDALARAATCR